jgi:Fe-S-cluster containining protein
LSQPQADATPYILDRDTGELLDLSPGGLCKACAGIGYTCCQPEYGVTVTFHDAKRMHRATGEPYEDFLAINRLDDDELVEGLEADRWFRQLFLGKRRLLQHIQHDLDCHFLGKDGCRAFEHRPRLCHFHPFWFRFKKDGTATVFYDAIDDREDADESDCVVVNKVWPNIPLGLKSIGEDPSSLSLQARMMREEIEWQASQVEELLKKTRPKDLTVAQLIPLIEAAPLFEV